ncbi:MAG: hypothetical protein QXI12_01145 [Candidatus Methanomethyliaceae archaeon]
MLATLWSEFLALPAEAWARRSRHRIVIDCWRVLENLERCDRAVRSAAGASEPSFPIDCKGLAMLTIFARRKAFTDPHTAAIQRNGITNWTLLRPRAEIMLCGDKDATGEICQELGLRHIPEVARNEYGTTMASYIVHRPTLTNLRPPLLSQWRHHSNDRLYTGCGKRKEMQAQIPYGRTALGFGRPRGIEVRILVWKRVFAPPSKSAHYYTRLQVLITLCFLTCFVILFRWLLWGDSLG